MDLPKNITQIGEADEACKIYVEDYVVSFLKQLNPLAKDKTMAAALYGKRKTEDNVTYLFVYGAGKLDFIQKETRHLSQAQKQEIERIRQQYFGEYEFLGYRILDGGMVDGFHVSEQDVCRYVVGYAQFYEKNEAMLSYMLESRQVEAPPENIDSEKYDAARSRQEKRREKYAHHAEENGEEEPKAVQRKGFRVAAAAVLVLLCALGLAMNSSILKENGLSWERIKEQWREKKLLEVAASEGQAVPSEPLMDPKKETEESQSEEGILVATTGKAEVAALGSDNADQGKVLESSRAGAEKETMQGKEEKETQAEETVKQEDAALNETKVTEKEGSVTEPEKASEEQKKEPVEYIVKKGDTLTGISLRNYGSEKYVNKICQLNSIQNPDEIQEGQKILLP